MKSNVVEFWELNIGEKFKARGMMFKKIAKAEKGTCGVGEAKVGKKKITEAFFAEEVCERIK